MSWRGMVDRCTNAKAANWRYYGGRVGAPVRVCERWRNFDSFLADLGERPDATTLDRLDPDGHYSCGTCDQCRERGWALNGAWATRREQAMTRGPDWFARLTRDQGFA